MKRIIFILIILAFSRLVVAQDETGGEEMSADEIARQMSNPIANWDTKALTLPIGGGPFKTIFMGKTPVKLGVQFNYYLSQPDPYGPQWGIRLNITPRLKRPW